MPLKARPPGSTSGNSFLCRGPLLSCEHVFLHAPCGALGLFSRVWKCCTVKLKSFHFLLVSDSLMLSEKGHRLLAWVGIGMGIFCTSILPDGGIKPRQAFSLGTEESVLRRGLWKLEPHLPRGGQDHGRIVEACVHFQGLEGRAEFKPSLFCELTQRPFFASYPVCNPVCTYMGARLLSACAV